MHTFEGWVCVSLCGSGLRDEDWCMNMYVHVHVQCLNLCMACMCIFISVLSLWHALSENYQNLNLHSNFSLRSPSWDMCNKPSVNCSHSSHNEINYPARLPCGHDAAIRTHASNFNNKCTISSDSGCACSEQTVESRRMPRYPRLLERSRSPNDLSSVIEASTVFWCCAVAMLAVLM